MNFCSSKNRFYFRRYSLSILLLAALLLVGVLVSTSKDTLSQDKLPKPDQTSKEKNTMKDLSEIDRGEFEVKLTPIESDDAAIGMMLLEKTFTGALIGTSKGRMMTAMTEVKGSAGYVAIEKVSGSLRGKKGTFMMQHFGTMADGNFHLVIEVVPNSGTEELKSLVGTLDIEIKDGKHFYNFKHNIPQ